LLPMPLRGFLGWGWRVPGVKTPGFMPRARVNLGREEGKCNRQNRKPFVVDPIGTNPTRQGLAIHRKRVLRGVWGNPRYEA
jgi:hypothetical protein